MILTNHHVAKFIYENNPQCILRTHKSINDKSSDILLNIHNNINNENALYRVVSKYNDNNIIEHSGLSIDYYTHFTSPIRRYVDITIHRLLYDIIDKNSDKNNDINSICIYANKIHKKVVQTHKDQNKLLIIKDIYNNSDSISTENAFVVFIKDNYLSVLIPKHNIISECKVISDKAKNYVDYISTNNFIKFNDKTINLFDEIKINIIIINKEFKMNKKLCIQLAN